MTTPKRTTRTGTRERGTNDGYFGIGGAFYPEHHPPRTWKGYVDLLAEAGISFVRLAEFAWDKLEPREGEYEFAWLDEAFALLAERRIRVVLCTPTAVPPIWACEKYPEIHPVLENGKTYGFGIRRYTCPTSSTYRSLCVNVASAMADHYGRNPQVFAWQIDNEIGHPFCFCDRCRREFQAWCRRRYGRIENYNDAVCAHFWGQTLTEFHQIPLPDTAPSPGLWLNYHQFHSDVIIDCYGLQAEAIRTRGAVAPVTTNMMPTWYGYDHEKMAKRLDVIGGDHYALKGSDLFGPPEDGFPAEAFVNAYLRGMKPGRTPWFLEFQWNRGSSTPGFGRVRWNALTQFGLGTDVISFFRFDTCPNGAERDGGLIGCHGQPGRTFHEVKALAADLRKLKTAVAGTAPARAEIGVLFTHDNHCEFTHNRHTDDFAGFCGNGYSSHIARHFGAIAGQNIPTDIVYPGADFGAYRILVAPAVYILPRSLAAKLEAFVKAGGTLIMTSLSGHADENAGIWDRPVPANLSDVFGIEVLEYGTWQPQAHGEARIVPSAGGFGLEPVEKVTWLDDITVRSRNVEVLAQFDNRFFAGFPAVTRHRFGKGTAYYLGAILDREGYVRFYEALCRELCLKPILALPRGVHATERLNVLRRIVFLNNPGSTAREVTLTDTYVDLLTRRKVSGTMTLNPFDVRILERS